MLVQHTCKYKDIDITHALFGRTRGRRCSTALSIEGYSVNTLYTMLAPVERIKVSIGRTLEQDLREMAAKMQI
jgi:hypothetical protein